MTYHSAYEDAFKVYNNNPNLIFLQLQWIILSLHSQSTNKCFEHICRKHGWLFKDTNIIIQRGKVSLCNSFLSHSKIFDKHDQRQHYNELCGESGGNK